MRVLALAALALCLAASWAEPETAEGLKKEVEKAASEAKAGAIAEAKKDGADAAKAEAAGKQAEADVRKEAAQQQAAEEKDRAPEGASGASSGGGSDVGASGDSGASGASGPPAGFVDPMSKNQITGTVIFVGYNAAEFQGNELLARKAVTDAVKIPLEDFAITGMNDPSARRRRLLNLGAAGAGGPPMVACDFVVGSESLDEAKIKLSHLGNLGSDRNVAKAVVMALRGNPKGAKCVGVQLKKMELHSEKVAEKVTAVVANVTVAKNETKNMTVTEVKAVAVESAMGLQFTWEEIGDKEIDAAAKKAAEWMARAEARLVQEGQAQAAVVGTHGQVKEHAGAAHVLAGEAKENAMEPGDTVIEQLKKSEDETTSAVEARRRLKVLREYRRKVSAKRKIATTTRDTTIAELLRLKILRINTAKQLWMTLANKVVDLNAVLKKRLAEAHDESELAHTAELTKKPIQHTMAQLEASQKAMEAARHTKVYLNAVMYKTKCAEDLLHRWECMVKVNCTGGGQSPVAGDDKPAWSTPTLDALAEKMNEATGVADEAKKAVPKIVEPPAPTPMSPLEKKLQGMEKKYKLPSDAAIGEKECQCALSDGKCGVWGANGLGCIVPKGEVDRDSAIDAANTVSHAADSVKADAEAEEAAAAGGAGKGGKGAKGKGGKGADDTDLLTRVKSLEKQLRNKVSTSLLELDELIQVKRASVSL